MYRRICHVRLVSSDYPHKQMEKKTEKFESRWRRSTKDISLTSQKLLRCTHDCHQEINSALTLQLDNQAGQKLHWFLISLPWRNKACHSIPMTAPQGQASPAQANHRSWMTSLTRGHHSQGHPNMGLDHRPWWSPCRGEYPTWKTGYMHTFIHNSDKIFFFTQMAKGTNEATQ